MRCMLGKSAGLANQSGGVRLRLLACLAAVFVATVVLPHAARPQHAATAAQMAERFNDMSQRAEAEGLAAPFTGITTDGNVIAHLFPVRATGVSTQPVREAADALLAALSREQRLKTLFPLDDPEWRKWMNQHFYVRQGVSFLEMTESQREVALGLLRASLSAKGLKQTRDIMRLNHTLGELSNDDFAQYGEWRYFLTIMGTPSATEPWGWQLDGHHAIINYFVMKDQVVMTPFFAGSEPVIATSGTYKGTSVLQEERSRGLAMVNALADAQRQRAVISGSKTGNNNLTEAFKDNIILDYAGLRGADMSAAQRRQLLDLITMYVDSMDEGHARVKIDEVREHLENTWFAWIGGTSEEAVFYYRIHSPVLLIEYDQQRPANLRHLAKDPSLPTPQHVHVVVRTPNGNDYGKDLLRQHYAQHSHSY